MESIGRIDATLSRAVEAKDVPGVVAMAATDSGVMYEGAFGLRDLANGPAMTRDTVFRMTLQGPERHKQFHEIHRSDHGHLEHDTCEDRRRADREGQFAGFLCRLLAQEATGRGELQRRRERAAERSGPYRARRPRHHRGHHRL